MRALFIFVAVASVVSVPAAAQRASVAPVWIADSKNGCQVWTDTPVKDEQVSWTGPCVNNFPHGRGVMQWYHRGHPTGRYDGDYAGGRMNGPGVLTLRDGRRLEGTWSNDRLAGAPIDSAGADLPVRHR